MTRLRALLVGVEEYTNMPSLNMPSAKRDIARIRGLLDSLASANRPLTRMLLPDPGLDPKIAGQSESQQTDKATIMYQLKEFLFKDAGAGDTLVFYFSGHSLLFTDPADATRVDEVLCPSDGGTSKIELNIHADEVVELAHDALKNGACLEIILETCSASGFVKTNGQTIYGFGCYFGGSGFPGGSGAVWSASLLQEHSHSGPVPSCSYGDVVGLFTEFFCKNFAGKTRLDLLRSVKTELDAYALDCNTHCCANSSNKMLAQTPKVYCLNGSTAYPLTTGCAATPEASVTVPTMVYTLNDLGRLRLFFSPTSTSSAGGLASAAAGGSGGLPISGSSASTLSLKFLKKPAICGPALLP